VSETKHLKDPDRHWLCALCCSELKGEGSIGKHQTAAMLPDGFQKVLAPGDSKQLPLNLEAQSDISIDHVGKVIGHICTNTSGVETANESTETLTLYFRK